MTIIVVGGSVTGGGTVLIGFFVVFWFPVPLLPLSDISSSPPLFAHQLWYSRAENN